MRPGVPLLNCVTLSSKSKTLIERKERVVAFEKPLQRYMCLQSVAAGWHAACNVKLKIENAHWAERMTRTRCGIWETATTRNFVLWLFLNNRNALWHVKICHVAKVVSWLLKEMTTPISDFMKIPQVVVVVNLSQPRRDVRHFATCRTVS